MHITPLKEEESGELKAYARDASWRDRPSTNGAKYYHAPGNEKHEATGYTLAKCSRRIMLNTFGVPLRIVNGLLCIKCYGSRSVEL